MKKRGHQPTGILVHTAKKTGFGSVLEMLAVKGPENIVKNRKKKNNTTENGLGGNPPKKKSKKVHPCTEIDLNVALNEDGKVEGGESKLKKMGQPKKKSGTESKKKTREFCLRSGIDWNVVLSIEEVLGELGDGDVRTSIIKKKLEKLIRGKIYIKRQKSGANQEDKKNRVQEEPMLDPTIKTQDTLYDSKISQVNIYQGSFTELIKKQEEAGEIYRSLSACAKNSGCEHLGEDQKQTINHDRPDAHISMPMPFNLTTVADIELPTEDVLQFVEFCSAFGEQLLSKEIPDAHVAEPPPCAPIENLASWCNFVHMIS